ncbi:MAG TPA: hypothetical protein VH475_01860 [Tepidisphaeraceae bacterium]|jgi:hypothetical protein
MNDEQLDQDLIDELLDRHFRACLDGQRGRAMAAFRKEIVKPRRHGRMWLSAGTAVAAGLLLAFAVFWHRPTNPPVVIVPDSTPEQPIPVVQTATWSGMIDGGTAVVDDQPVRQFRRKVVEQVEWYDAKDNAVVRTTLPRQQIFLIGMQTD